MRQVNLPWVFGMADPTPSTAGAAAAECLAARENGQRVIAAAIAVERELEKIINSRIAGEPDKVNVFFAERILSAEWFSFGSKKKVALDVFAEYEHLKGDDKASIDQLLRKVMSLRNRFAHGDIIVKGSDVYVKYFDQQTKEELLSDEFWLSVEQTFTRTIELLLKGQASMGITVGWGKAEPTVRYFAYGSNLFTARLKARVPNASLVTVAILDDHALKFHKRSGDGSGKCNVMGSPGDVVIGVIFDIPAHEKPGLDQAEGLGKGYEERTLVVRTASGETHAAVAYVANADSIDDDLRPYTWYREYVLRGAREHNFPEPYIERLASVEAWQDPNSNREAKELNLLATAG